MNPTFFCLGKHNPTSVLGILGKPQGPGGAHGRRAAGTHWSTLLAMEAMMKRTASVTSQGGFPSFSVA